MFCCKGVYEIADRCRSAKAAWLALQAERPEVVQVALELGQADVPRNEVHAVNAGLDRLHDLDRPEGFRDRLYSRPHRSTVGTVRGVKEVIDDLTVNEIGGQVALRVGVDQKHTVATSRERRAEVHRQRRFADPALVVEDRQAAGARTRLGHAACTVGAEVFTGVLFGVAARRVLRLGAPWAIAARAASRSGRAAMNRSPAALSCRWPLVEGTR